MSIFRCRYSDCFFCQKFDYVQSIFSFWTGSTFIQYAFSLPINEIDLLIVHNIRMTHEVNTQISNNQKLKTLL